MDDRDREAIEKRFQVEVVIDGRSVPLKPFLHNMLGGALEGLVHGLKGVDGPQTISIRSTKIDAETATTQAAAEKIKGVGQTWTLGVLLGGKSTRMGRDKAELPIGDETLIEFIVRRCRPAGDSVLFASGSDKRPLPKGIARYPSVFDSDPSVGPLAGIAAMVVAAPTDWLVVVPCDMPFLTTAILETLIRGALSSGAEVAVFKHRHRPESFPIAVSTRIADRIVQGIKNGNRRVQDLLVLGRAVVLDAAEVIGHSWDARLFENINTPEDWRRSSDLLLPGKPKK